MVHMKIKPNCISYAKLLAALITVAGMLFSMTGCSEDDTPPFMEEYEAPKALEHTTIKFLFPGGEPKNWDKVKAEIEKRSADTVNVSLDFRWELPVQYDNTVKMLDASGEVYDAFIFSKPDSRKPDFTKVAREGKLKDITKLFPRNAPSLFSKYTVEELDYASLDGKIYAVPSLQTRAFCSYLMVDDELLKKYNLPDITDFDKFETFLKTIKENEPDLIPGTITNMSDTLDLFARASGYVIADEARRLLYKWEDHEMKLVPWEKTSEFYEIVGYIVDWYKNGYLKFNAYQSKTASYIHYGDLEPLSQSTAQMYTMDASGKLVGSNPLRCFHLYPEKPVQRDNPMGTFNGSGSFVFPAASDNTERALRFLEWVQQSSKNNYLVCYGIEGEDYVWSKGSPTLPEGMDYGNRSYFLWDGCFAFYNIEYNSIISDDSEITETAKDFMDKNTKYPPHGAFYPNYGVLQITADERQKYFTEFETRLTQGLIQDMAEVDAFINKLDEIGSAELVEEAQKQMTVGE